MTLLGFRSRWMMPAECERDSASAICTAYCSALVQREAVAGDYIIQGLALDVLHADEVDSVGLIDVVDGDDVGVIEC